MGDSTSKQLNHNKRNGTERDKHEMAYKTNRLVKYLATIFFFIISLSAFAQPKHYYVASAPLGNDANSALQAQSQATPWATTARINTFWTSLKRR
jgi:polyferredoxin